MSKIKITGLDEMQKMLKKMEKGAEEMDGKHLVSFNELFPTSFMHKYTEFNSFDELLDFGGWEVNTQDDFSAIPDDEFDSLISSKTKFSDWEEMKSVGAKEYALHKLGF